MSKKKKTRNIARQTNKPVIGNSSNDEKIIVHEQRIHKSFSGPLPHPDVLQRFEEVTTGSAERIIKMAEEQSLHRRELERKVIEADISRSKRGQILGFIIAITGLSVSALIGVYGNPVAGGWMGFGTVAALVGVFMYGNFVKSEELKEKKEEL